VLLSPFNSQFSWLLLNQYSSSSSRILINSASKELLFLNCASVRCIISSICSNFRISSFISCFLLLVSPALLNPHHLRNFLTFFNLNNTLSRHTTTLVGYSQIYWIFCIHSPFLSHPTSNLKSLLLFLGDYLVAIIIGL
jgi:hypothetical protein